MKKSILLVAGISLLALGSLVGCGAQNEYDLIYRTWDTGTVALNNPERQLVKAFEEANNVKIKIIDNPGSGDNYWTGIEASVLKDNAADVFMTPNMDYPLKAQYALDISSYAQADEEWSNIPNGIENACHFKSGIYAIPARMNMSGFFINKTIANNLNKSIDINSTIEDVLGLLSEVKKDKSLVGMNNVDNLYEILPSCYDKTQGYYTWDGSKYNLDSEAFKKSITTAKNIYDSKYSYDSLSDVEQAFVGKGNVGDEGVIGAWDKGYMALRYGFTFEIPDMIGKNPQFDIEFIANPGGKTPIIGDYYCVYKNSKNPELAYKFAKWMSFGKEGMQKRFDFYKAFDAGGNNCNTLPLSTDTDVLNRYFELFPDDQSMSSGTVVQGVKKAFESLGTGMPEGVKVVPGYNQSRWKAKTGVKVEIPNPSDSSAPLVYENAEIGQFLDACVKGNGNLIENATNLNTLANSSYTKWMTSYGVKYN